MYPLLQLGNIFFLCNCFRYKVKNAEMQLQEPWKKKKKKKHRRENAERKKMKKKTRKNHE